MIELTITFTNVDPDVLELCHVGEMVDLWTKPEVDFIFFYARRTVGGQGRIAKLLKSISPELAANLERTTTQILSADNNVCVILCSIE